ncbi:MAG TPA: hypothetical protein DCS42_09700 [Nitrospiraceae bacterium]|nr:hypothetical protein [Nitrospiraceae bacterium]
MDRKDIAGMICCIPDDMLISKIFKEGCFMKRFSAVVLAVAATVLLLNGCMKVAPSPALPGGGKIVMFVIIDRGVENGFTDYQIKNRHQLGAFMDKDLVAMLSKAGYEPRLIQKRSEYKPGKNSYLLQTRILNYNPGSKAARMVVGFGAGSVGMDLKYELHGVGKEPLLSDKIGKGTSGEWQYLVRKLELAILEAVSAKLHQTTK